MFYFIIWRMCQSVSSRRRKCMTHTVRNEHLHAFDIFTDGRKFPTFVHAHCYICIHRWTVGEACHLEVRVVEVVRDVPAKHQELAALNQHGVEVAQAEQELLVFVRLVTTIKLEVAHTLIHPLHVRLQTLQLDIRVINDGLNHWTSSGQWIQRFTQPQDQYCAMNLMISSKYTFKTNIRNAYKQSINSHK